MMKMTKKIALETAIKAIKANIEGGVTEITVPGTGKDVVEVSFPMTEVLEKLEGMRNDLVKRAETPKKPTKQQEANETIKARVLEILADNKFRTVTEILACDPEVFKDVSNQRMSRLLADVVAGGSLVRTEVKRKAYYGMRQE